MLHIRDRRCVSLTFYLEKLKKTELEDGNIISKYVNDRIEFQ